MIIGTTEWVEYEKNDLVKKINIYYIRWKEQKQNYVLTFRLNNSNRAK